MNYKQLKLHTLYTIIQPMTFQNVSQKTTKVLTNHVYNEMKT